jgi:hypothetical protein
VSFRVFFQRTSLVLGLVSLGLALWSGTHLQHLLDNGGGRHAGEFGVAILLALLVFAGGWYGVKHPQQQ